jgi:hypothetical protein
MNIIGIVKNKRMEPAFGAWVEPAPRMGALPFPPCYVAGHELEISLLMEIRS